IAISRQTTRSYTVVAVTYIWAVENARESV
ncbi:unnamed protein product, partial [marine sediment metagenome]